MQKIFYYEGDEFSYKTFIKPGIITEEKNCFVIKTRQNKKYLKKLELRYLREFDLVKVDGVGYVIKIRLKSKKIIYLGAYEGLCILNFFLHLDETKTIKLAEKIVYKFKNNLRWFKSKEEKSKDENNENKKDKKSDRDKNVKKGKNKTDKTKKLPYKVVGSKD